MGSPVTGHPSPVTIQDIPLSQLRESPLNARKNFDPAKLKELADSIREKGILTPLLVRPRHYELASKEAREPDMTWEILAGARRFRAAKLHQSHDPRLARILAGQNGEYAVPCVVREASDVDALEIITMENLQRQDLSAIEEAQGFKALLDLGKYDVAALAKRLGKSQSYVYQRVKLTELIPGAAKALSEEKITPGHGILLARLQPHEQTRELDKILDQEKETKKAPSVREVQRRIKRPSAIRSQTMQQPNCFLHPNVRLACSECDKHKLIRKRREESRPPAKPKKCKKPKVQTSAKRLGFPVGATPPPKVKSKRKRKAGKR